MRKVDAVVFVGDVVEEDIDELGHQAGQLGLVGTPVFVFHEGGEPIITPSVRADRAPVWRSLLRL